MDNDSMLPHDPGETCPHCGTPLQRATVDFEQTPDVTEDLDQERSTFQPGEMAAVDFCPNPDCPGKHVTPPGVAR